MLFVVVFEGLTYPDTWGPHDNDDPYRTPRLSPDSPEYKEVLENVMKTAGSRVRQVVKVCIHIGHNTNG